jgi:hypothetical protein
MTISTELIDDIVGFTGEKYILFEIVLEMVKNWNYGRNNKKLELKDWQVSVYKIIAKSYLQQNCDVFNLEEKNDIQH